MEDISENAFIKQNYGLASQIVRKFYFKNSSYEYEDMMQVALMAMLRAYRKYDPQRGKFSTFATFCIRNDLIKLIQKHNRNKTVLSGDMTQSSYHETDNIFEFIPNNLTNNEFAIFYYKKMNYKDKEIRDILDLSNEDYKIELQSLNEKINISNE